MRKRADTAFSVVLGIVGGILLGTRSADGIDWAKAVPLLAGALSGGVVYVFITGPAVDWVVNRLVPADESE